MTKPGDVPAGADAPVLEVAWFESLEAYKLMLPNGVRRRIPTQRRALRLGAYAIAGHLEGPALKRAWPVVECRAVDRSWVVVLLRGQAREDMK